MAKRDQNPLSQVLNITNVSSSSQLIANEGGLEIAGFYLRKALNDFNVPIEFAF